MCQGDLNLCGILTALMGVAELAKGIQYEDPIKTGYAMFLLAPFCLNTDC